MCCWTDPHCNSIEMMSTENTSLLPLFNPQLIYFYHSKSINFLFRIVIVEILVMQMIVRYNPNRIKYLLYFWRTCHCWPNKVKVILYFFLLESESASAFSSEASQRDWLALASSLESSFCNSLAEAAAAIGVIAINTIIVDDVIQILIEYYNLCRSVDNYRLLSNISNILNFWHFFL